MNDNARRKFGRIIVGAVVALGGIGSVPALGQDSKPVTLDFGSTFVGSTWYQYAAAMAPMMQAALPPDSNVTVRPYAGAAGNIDLIAKDQKIQLGLTFNASANWAANAGDERSSRRRPSHPSPSLWMLGEKPCSCRRIVSPPADLGAERLIERARPAR